MRSLLFASALAAIACDARLASDDASVALRDAGVRDASFDPDAFVPADGAIADGGVIETGPILYPDGRRHSPITIEIAMRLEEIAANDPTRNEDLFSKIGDSITVATSFMHCFSGGAVTLEDRPLDFAIDHFLGGDPDPFTRTSESATGGWAASAALAGDPSPLDRELDAIAPRYGVVMFGTNDSGYREVQDFARNMIEITDTMIARGTIPLLSSIPPRDNDAEVDARVPTFNLAVRAIAQGRGVPFVDFHRELLPLEGHGLAGDGVHLRSYAEGNCVFTEEGLTAAAVVRNLITIEQLDRALAARSGVALDESAPRLSGAGSIESPFEIELWPFAAMGDTRRSDRRSLAVYTGCGAAQDESGPEELWRFSIDRAARVEISILSSSGADVDVHLLDASASEEGCLARGDRNVTADLDAGQYYVAADTFVGAAGEQPGEYLLLAREL